MRTWVNYVCIAIISETGDHDANSKHDTNTSTVDVVWEKGTCESCDCTCIIIRHNSMIVIVQFSVLVHVNVYHKLAVSCYQ